MTRKALEIKLMQNIQLLVRMIFIEDIIYVMSGANNENKVDPSVIDKAPDKSNEEDDKYEAITRAMLTVSRRHCIFNPQ